MKINLIFWAVVILLFLAGCTALKEVTAENYHLYRIPPNGVKITDHLYCDRTEVSNLNYSEYLAWLERIFGRDSYEHISSVPDTTYTATNNQCLHDFFRQYLSNHIYYDFPVTGISQKQAERYSKWRSDRVFEVTLIELGIISFIENQDKDNYFTIEKYFTGKLDNVISNKKIEYYPDFRLPDLRERALILAYADAHDKKYASRNCKNNPKIHCEINPCLNKMQASNPYRQVNQDCSPQKGNPIYHLRGNVSEWSAIKNVSFGGGWIHTRDQIVASDTISTTGKNHWTGFRNVCQWKKWK